MSYQQTIYSLLRKAGMTEAGALGVLGNFDCESNCEPCRLQGDFSANRTLSKEYVRRADSGQMTESEFAKPTGFGLAQWTYPQRKINLWRFWKQYGGSLGSVEMQVAFALKEFKTEFIADWRLLCSTGDIREAAKAVCDRYENPAIHNVDARYQSALRIRSEIDLKADFNSEPIEEPDLKQDEQNYKPRNWPPRMICKGMSGYDVLVCKSVLMARGYTLAEYDDIDFDDELDEEVREFQKTHGLDPDGIVGPLTWGKLLER